MHRNFECYWKKARKIIDKRLDEMIKKLFFVKYIGYALKGGKRFRGTLTLLTAQALGGSIEEALPFSVAVELVHQGLLIHDDFIDAHESRRGRPPLYKVLDPRVAFLIADMLLAYAQLSLIKSRDGYRTLAKAIYEVCRGVCLEPLNPLRFLQDLKKRSMSESFYLSLVRLKTATLFGTACELGALSSKAESALSKRAYNYGIQLGTAYQIADDYADYLLARVQGKIDVPTAVRLMPAFLYFAPNVLPRIVFGITKRKSNDVVRILKEIDLTEKFKAEIRSYIELAKDEIVRFPENEYKKLLLEAPDYFVRKMIEIAWSS